MDMKYSIEIEYNAPGFHPITVVLTVGTASKEFNGKNLKSLLKQAIENIADIEIELKGRMNDD
jgi:hypothetical protein